MKFVTYERIHIDNHFCKFYELHIKSVSHDVIYDKKTCFDCAYYLSLLRKVVLFRR